MWDRRAQYLGNHDGDSCQMFLDQGYFDRKVIEVRLLDVWAPELNQRGGMETRDFVRDWFLSNIKDGDAWPFIVTTMRMKVADREQKTFDRYVATVTTRNPDYSLNKLVNAFVKDNGYGSGITTARDI